tara:strand:- start:126789 stop:127088 length:300 start_codon:yes stop_codon:yes gene_type:complete
MAQEKSVLSCLSPGHTFIIKQTLRSRPTEPKQLVGTLSTASRKPQVLDCTEKNTGYVCKKGDFVAKVLRGSVTGRTIVQLELEGEYDVESGYIGTIYCR